MVQITTFGYLHAPPPDAHLVLDLRIHFRDPHVNPALRHMTAHEAPVRAAVLATPGISDLVQATAAAVLAYLAGPGGGAVMVAVGCAGGRHRAATVGMSLAAALTGHGVTVALYHRDMVKPVIER